MTFYDFEYDGILLSDLECIVCSFDGTPDPNGTGNEISFNLVSTRHGEKFEFISSQYDDTLELVFQICRNPCMGANPYFSREEVEYICSWLSRRNFHKFKVKEENYENLYFESSSNIKRVTNGSNVIGFEITMKTNSPNPFYEPISITTTLSPNTPHRFESVSDEESCIYPKMIIKVKQDGDLHIINERDSSHEMFIKNCKNGEVITVDYPMIETSLISHKILNDFNWSFYAIWSNFYNRTNSIQSTLPCEITMTYNPIAKIGY